MNRLYQTKLNDLLTEFTRYLVEHPTFAARIPADAQVVLLDREDPSFNIHALQSAKLARQFDELPNRAMIFVEVQELAPIRSRVKKLQILSTPPEYAPAI